METLEKLKSQASAAPRVMIRPKVDVHARTEESRRQVRTVARRVIQTHYDVLLALKNR